MVLADHQIEWLVEMFGSTIEPYNPENLQPSSYDVTLGNSFKIMQWSKEPLDPFNQNQLDRAYYTLHRKDDEAFVLPPGQFVLGVTKERVAVPPDLVCRLEGRSSVGRLGITVHITAGYIDPGFVGNLTLEMMSFAPRPIILTPGMTIAQIGFLKMAAPARTPYKGRYQGDTTATHSRYGKNMEDHPE
jgi:dCTP deaminase